jgi:hypothetical protein
MVLALTRGAALRLKIYASGYDYSDDLEPEIGA